MCYPAGMAANVPRQMAAKRRNRKLRPGRPGMPRKKQTLNRITLRVHPDVYEAMWDACDERDVTQRELVEEALLEEFTRPVEPNTFVPPPGKPSRTGMWIDPAIMKRLDERERDEDLVTRRAGLPAVTQRAVIERAIRRELGMPLTKNTEE